MNALEKWQRLENPTCLADYGLSLSEAEMREFPAGRAILSDIIRERRRRVRESRMIASMANGAALTIEAVALSVLANNTPQRMARPSAGATYAGGDGSEKGGES